jgi:hypothetical protein
MILEAGQSMEDQETDGYRDTSVVKTAIREPYWRCDLGDDERLAGKVEPARRCEQGSTRHGCPLLVALLVELRCGSDGFSG